MEGRLSMSSLLLSISNDSRAPRSLDAFDEIATLPWFIRVILSIVQLVYHALHECFELVVHSLGCAYAWCDLDLRDKLLIWIER